MHSNRSLYWVAVFILLMSVIGFADATFLTAKHYLGGPLPCSIFTGCEEVTTSSYSVIMGIPVALFGACYYLAIMLLALVYIDRGSKVVIRLIALLTPLGFIASLWFLYLQFVVIKALCLYCMISALTSSILFILGLYVAKNIR